MSPSFPHLIFCVSLFPVEEFIQSVQSTAGMAVVLLIRSVTENEEDVAKEVRVINNSNIN